MVKAVKSPFWMANHRTKTPLKSPYLKPSGGRFQVRFLDGEEREVSKVREPPAPWKTVKKKQLLWWVKPPPMKHGNGEFWISTVINGDYWC